MKIRRLLALVLMAAMVLSFGLPAFAAEEEEPALEPVETIAEEPAEDPAAEPEAVEEPVALSEEPEPAAEPEPEEEAPEEEELLAEEEEPVLDGTPAAWYEAFGTYGTNYYYDAADPTVVYLSGTITLNESVTVPASYTLDATKATVTGSGSITVASGATVIEAFAIQGSYTVSDMYSAIQAMGVFGFDSYTINSVQVPVTVLSGGTEKVRATAYVSDIGGGVTIYSTTAGVLIGANGLIVPADGTTVTKTAGAGSFALGITGSASVSAFSLPFVYTSIDETASADIFPLNNAAINVSDGTTTLSSGLLLDAGSSFTVAAGAELTLGAPLYANGGAITVNGSASVNESTNTNDCGIFVKSASTAIGGAENATVTYRYGGIAKSIIVKTVGGTVTSDTYVIPDDFAEVEPNSSFKYVSGAWKFYGPGIDDTVKVQVKAVSGQVSAVGTLYNNYHSQFELNYGRIGSTVKGTVYANIGRLDVDQKTRTRTVDVADYLDYVKDYLDNATDTIKNYINNKLGVKDAAGEYPEGSYNKIHNTDYDYDHIVTNLGEEELNELLLELADSYITVDYDLITTVLPGLDSDTRFDVGSTFSGGVTFIDVDDNDTITDAGYTVTITEKDTTSTGKIVATGAPDSESDVDDLKAIARAVKAECTHTDSTLGTEATLAAGAWLIVGAENLYLNSDLRLDDVRDFSGNKARVLSATLLNGKTNAELLNGADIPAAYTSAYKALAYIPAGSVVIVENEQVTLNRGVYVALDTSAGFGANPLAKLKDAAVNGSKQDLAKAAARIAKEVFNSVTSTGNNVTVWFEKEEEEATAEYVYSLSLDGKIGLNYYVKNLQVDGMTPTDEQLSKFEIQYSTDGTNYTSKTLTSKTSDCTTVAHFAAAEMNDLVYVKVLYDGLVIKEAQYSVRGYCETCIGLNNAETDICKAILTYGGYAQVLFNKDTDNLAYSTYKNDLNDSGLDGFARSSSTTYVSPVTSGTVKLALETATELHFTLVTTGDGTETVAVDRYYDEDGVTVTAGQIEVFTAGIPAYELDQEVTVTVGSFSTTWSALNFAYAAQNSALSQPTKDACVALYNYYQAAQTYFNP